MCVGLISYKVNTTYAVFTDTIIGSKTIELTVDTCSSNKPNAPVLDDAMIPVYYDEDSETWKKADSTNKGNNWYDYCEKKWANSVTVSSTNRETYKNASVGTEIPMDDILTMQVWIPRYKYKVWNYNAEGTTTSSPQQIEITFEDGTAKTGEISCEDAISGTDGDPSETCKLKETNTTCTDSTCNNKTYTHPAFTFGDEELKGFWIGKFELTGTISNITVKPNLSSLREQTVSSFETNIMNMKNSGNSYGFNTSTDTHMIKNSEWGAVTYLSHSKYGINKKIEKNSASTYTTGCGPQSEGSTSYGSTCNAYATTLGQSASTTGNVYGVYDMSGGAWEYTMANMIYENGVDMFSYDSGYSGYKLFYNIGEIGLDTSGISYPNEKYYDKYSYSTSFSTRKRSKLGDGIKEVYERDLYGWYSNKLSLAHSDAPWFERGNFFKSSAGMFASSYDTGDYYSTISSRIIITP